MKGGRALRSAAAFYRDRYVAYSKLELTDRSTSTDARPKVQKEKEVVRKAEMKAEKWILVIIADKTKMSRHRGSSIPKEVVSTGDCVVRTADGGVFTVHRALLAASSAYFKGALSEDAPVPSEVQLDNVSAAVFEELLCFLYTDNTIMSTISFIDPFPSIPNTPIHVVLTHLREPGPFSGTDKVYVEKKLTNYECASKTNRWNPTLMLANVSYYLRGTARVWLDTTEEDLTSWDMCLGSDNVLQVLEAADYLMMDDARDRSLRYLIWDMRVENCLGFAVLLKPHYSPFFLEALFSFIREHFDEVWRHSDEFPHVSTDLLIELLESDELNVWNEADLLRAIDRWYSSAKHEDGPSALLQLLRCVRIGHCSQS
ncbi:hypothetical protein HPB51_007502 [Rhipicephalus microplus]|uniref:BTB domain-containing protein n=1 Tax=Rhipicephalus microplus TaxID=6941 RepID=A0A9J6DTM7_RHIMP|nr:hypothetical protein HPB51_007502 [Rhipicephalus microplus]